MNVENGLSSSRQWECDVERPVWILRRALRASGAAKTILRLSRSCSTSIDNAVRAFDQLRGCETSSEAMPQFRTDCWARRFNTFKAVITATSRFQDPVTETNPLAGYEVHPPALDIVFAVVYKEEFLHYGFAYTCISATSVSVDFAEATRAAMDDDAPPRVTIAALLAPYHQAVNPSGGFQGPLLDDPFDFGNEGRDISNTYAWKENKLTIIDTRLSGWLSEASNMWGPDETDGVEALRYNSVMEEMEASRSHVQLLIGAFRRALNTVPVAGCIHKTITDGDFVVVDKYDALVETAEYDGFDGIDSIP